MIIDCCEAKQMFAGLLWIIQAQTFRGRELSQHLELSLLPFHSLENTWSLVQQASKEEGMFR